MSKRQLVIEFIGLPGAGKSTISKQVKEELKERNIIFDDLFNAGLPMFRLNRTIWKVVHVIKEIVSRPVFNLKQISLIFKTKQDTFMDFIKVTVNWIIMNGQIKRKLGTSVISDQGIVQAVWSILLTSRQNIGIEKFLSQTKLPDIVFYVKIDRDVMNLRLKIGIQSKVEWKEKITLKMK